MKSQITFPVNLGYFPVENCYDKFDAFPLFPALGRYVLVLALPWTVSQLRRLSHPNPELVN
jgi:hypothetical protein